VCLNAGEVRMYYNETQVRREFVNPFFKAFGCNIDKNKGFLKLAISIKYRKIELYFIFNEVPIESMEDL
jgi:hypothetical protein